MIPYEPKSTTFYFSSSLESKDDIRLLLSCLPPISRFLYNGKWYIKTLAFWRVGRRIVSNFSSPVYFSEKLGLLSTIKIPRNFKMNIICLLDSCSYKHFYCFIKHVKKRHPLALGLKISFVEKKDNIVMGQYRNDTARTAPAGIDAITAGFAVADNTTGTPVLKSRVQQESAPEKLFRENKRFIFL